MSARSVSKARGRLDAAVEALTSAIAEAELLLSNTALESARAARARLTERLEHSSEHTVIGLFGSTGSGKSSLVNAIVGEEIARVAHRRPTTSTALAVLPEVADEYGGSSAASLLDWLEIRERHTVGRGSLPQGAILVDLPDFDSVESANREIAERLAGTVDVLVWVTDPEKYADAVLHTEFISRFARHDAVTIVVVNQADRLSKADGVAVRSSMKALLDDDGLAKAQVLLVSAVDGTGLPNLREEIASVVESKRAVLERLLADARAEGEMIAEAVGVTVTRKSVEIPSLPREVPTFEVDRLEEACAGAAQVEKISEAVAKSYRTRAGRHTGWPALRWIGSFKVDPLERMRIGRASNRHRKGDSDEEFVSRSSLSIDAPGARARMNRAVDEFALSIAGDAPHPWPGRLTDALDKEKETLPDEVDYALTHTNFRGSEKSWTWLPLNIVQWLAFLTAIAGLVWLLALAGFDFLQVPKPPMPMLEGLWVPVPVPTAMIIAGLGLGILLGIFAAFLNSIVAGSRKRRIRRALRSSLREAAERTVVAGAQNELDRASRLESALAELIAST
ncbi:50S ribosome-binding GTPase [Dermabacter sp. p3-SID358]|uniref:GTPase family protein n=1 Tax=Dermabacter sp. p3-SID358 TaxID=2916114 RepID=UPI0021A91076|nr:GTPase [Dermabacter sp. p3-SID358]MCT1867249.1 50S ribosome-binding GTPase [Dermabacter sp. p3-SID358]